MFIRHLMPLLTEELQHSPAVALLGPRQSGKTTLALEAAKSIPSLYLDLESERDRAKLAQAELYLSDHLDKLVILDEVHRAPQLFPVLRGLIDQARGARPGARGEQGVGVVFDSAGPRARGPPRAVPAVGLSRAEFAATIRRNPGRAHRLP
jgi:hypothetical protein